MNEAEKNMNHYTVSVESILIKQEDCKEQHGKGLELIVILFSIEAGLLP